MDYKHTCDTILSHFQGITNYIYGFGRPFLRLHFFTRPPIFLPVHIHFTHPNDRWMGLYIKLCATVPRQCLQYTQKEANQTTNTISLHTTQQQLS